MIFTDSHAHLPAVAEELGDDALASLLSDYADAAVAAGREGRASPLLVDIGTEPEDLSARIKLLKPEGRSAFLCLAAGIWPSANNLASPAGNLSLLESAIEEASSLGIRIAAIGEGGLDYHHAEGGKEAQERLFEGQLGLALRLGLPMIVHSRDAFDDTRAIIARAVAERGALAVSSPIIIHCFGYGLEEARAFLSLGCRISFAGNLSYKGSDALRAACAVVPDDAFLLETDSPYMNPMPRRGKPTSPRDIERTYALAAGIRSVSVEALADRVSRNARALFG